MLRVIIEREIRDLIGSTKFAVTFGVCALLLLTAFYVGGVRYGVYQRQHEASAAENLRRLEGQTDWLSVNGTRVFLPPQTLSTIVSGVSNDIGRKGSVYGGAEVGISDSRYNEDPIFAIFRFLDVEFVFSILLSLFAILLGYDAISGEKERGTLRLTFANAVPRHTFILGKLIGSMLTLAVSVVITSALGSLMLPLLGVPLSSADWLKLGLIVTTGLLYLGVFLSLSLFISALTHRSSNSFLLLVVIWIGAVMIVPRVSVLTAGRAVEVPSVDELANQRATFARQLREEFIDGLNNFKMPGSGSGMDQMAVLQTYMDSISEIRLSKMKDLTDRLNEDRENRQQVQENFAFNLARISPATSLSLATTALAGTSLRLKNDYKAQAEEYQTTYANFIEEKTGMNPRGLMHIRRVETVVGEDGEQVRPENIDPTEMPAFVFTSSSVDQALSTAAIDMGLLAIFNLLFFAGTFVAFVRYDVR